MQSAIFFYLNYSKLIYPKFLKGWGVGRENLFQQVFPPHKYLKHKLSQRNVEEHH